MAPSDECAVPDVSRRLQEPSQVCTFRLLSLTSADNLPFAATFSSNTFTETKRSSPPPDLSASSRATLPSSAAQTSSPSSRKRTGIASAG